MSVNNIVVGIGASIMSTCILVNFLRQRRRHEQAQWRGGIPMSGVSQILFLGGLLSVAIGALTGAILFFASIFLVTFILGSLSHAKDRITHFHATGRKFQRSKEILYAILPVIMLFMLFIAPILGKRNILNLNDKEWFSIAFLIFALLLFYIYSKPKKLKKYHRTT